ILATRRKQSEYYDHILQKLGVRKPVIFQGCDYNYAYYPIIFPDETYSSRAKARLEQSDIFPRRYFSPSLSKLEYVDSIDMPISDSICGSILCFPLFHDLTENQQDLIGKVLLVV